MAEACLPNRRLRKMGIYVFPRMRRVGPSNSDGPAGLRTAMLFPWRDVQKLVTFLGELSEPRTAAEFPAHLVSLVEAMLPGVIVALDEIPAPGQYRLTHNLPIDPAVAAGHFATLGACYQENPIYNIIQEAREVTAIRISDVASRRRFCNTTLYQEVFRHLSIEHQLHVVIPVSVGQVSMSLNHRRDFSDEQTELFRMLAPEIARAYHRAQSGPPATETLSGESLTARESEVLRWVSAGKRNSEIARILGISERTVEKHVERVLVKCGVESRLSLIQQNPLAPATDSFSSGIYLARR